VITTKKKISRTKEVLQEVGLKVTRPRLAILNVLLKDHGPFTMDEIHKVVRKEVDRVTVYRCVETFQELGIARRCDFGEGPVRYEYQGLGVEHHHHVICRKCKKVESLSACAVKNLEKTVEKAGYSNVTHSLEFFGICENCD
jgi:Fur family transcriptional regulator, ferric uptake regulator